MPKRIYPIDRLSYSALKEYLGNPWRFYRLYVQKIQTFTDSPATLVGRAFHKYLELYYSSPTFRTAEGHALALDPAIQIIRNAAGQVDWGKTGSVEKAEAEAIQTIEHYFLDDPKYEDRYPVIETERILQGVVRGFPVTIKAVADLILENNGEIGIVDFKKVSQLSDKLQPAYYIQAWFNFKSLYASTKKKASFMIFHEVKTSKNREGGPQGNQLMIKFGSEEWAKMDQLISKMVKDMLKDISRKNRVWLPNISDQMAGEESWQEFTSS